MWHSPTEQIDARFPQRFEGVAPPQRPQTLQGVPYRVDGDAAQGYGSTIYGQFVNYGECDPSGEPLSRLPGDGCYVEWGWVLVAAAAFRRNAVRAQALETHGPRTVSTLACGC